MDAVGNVLGNKTLKEALAEAARDKKDLVQLGFNPKDKIARCVITSYPYFLAKLKQKKKPPKPQKVKTARFREDIESNDIRTKAKQTRKWLEKGLTVELLVSVAREQMQPDKPFIPRKPIRQKGDTSDKNTAGSIQPTFRRKNRKKRRDFFTKSKSAKHGLPVKMSHLEEGASGVHRVYEEVLAELGEDVEVMGIVTNGLLFTMRIKHKPQKKKPQTK